ncbi:MAG TPA: FAD binding domain-containing protein, partial [Candidatus Dormibacteraeota bacterium]|nr:FAD binding domain-containing protein [Candidatus Dormibacteraeota bacterium]
MDFLQPSTWNEAVEMKAAHPEATPIWGATDVLVEINLDHKRPATILDLTRV